MKSKAAIKRWNQSLKGKAAMQKYRQSDKGKAAYKKRHPHKRGYCGAKAFYSQLARIEQQIFGEYP